jgi:hypothetical protein
VVVLVARHARDVEEDPAQRVRHARLHRTQTVHELAIAVAATR